MKREVPGQFLRAAIRVDVTRLAGGSGLLACAVSMIV